MPVKTWEAVACKKLQSVLHKRFQKEGANKLKKRNSKISREIIRWPVNVNILLF